MSKGKIVLVTNTKKIPTRGYAKHTSSLDITKNITNYLISKAIKDAGYDFVWYRSINSFLDNINKHKNDLIFPYSHGIASKIRQSFVQTFCENAQIKYIGAEAHTQTVANDKVLSKDICRYAGILSPNGKIMLSKEYPPDISVLKLPLIVKPQFEGDSIGISSSNVFYTYEGVLTFAETLIEDLSQPVVIEEYIKGQELSVCLIGYKRNIKQIGIVKQGLNGRMVNSFFNKKFTFGPCKYKIANDLLTNKLEQQVKDLFHYLDKVEFMRVDFILKDGDFYNIELTTDPDLSPFSSMYLSMKDKMKYADFIDYIISNCVERYKII